jgi:hypothetical protein
MATRNRVMLLDLLRITSTDEAETVLQLRFHWDSSGRDAMVAEFPTNRVETAGAFLAPGVARGGDLEDQKVFLYLDDSARSGSHCGRAGLRGDRFGGSMDLTVNYDATGLTGGTYNCEFRISSNAANSPQVVVPVELTVIEDTSPPFIETENKLELWPPNHKYQTVSVADMVIAVVDNCDGMIDESQVRIDYVLSGDRRRNRFLVDVQTDPGGRLRHGWIPSRCDHASHVALVVRPTPNH